MKIVTETERKEISVEILSDFDRICRKYGITYYLAYGTLIGAVRHKGFIPWDDDIDVWIPIHQIEKLFEHLRQESKYQLIDHFKDTNWVWPFSKLVDTRTIDIDIDSTRYEALQTQRGQAIDLFPLLKVESIDSATIVEMQKCEKKIEILFKYEKGFFDKNIPKKLFCEGLKAVRKDTNYYRKKIYELELSCKDGKLSGYPFSPYQMKDFHTTKAFEPTELEFEGKRFMAPSGYDEILTNIYGDYMTLPPKDKQVTRHLSYQTYWKEG